MKAKVGDIIVITNGPKTALPEDWNGRQVSVVKVDKENAWCNAKELNEYDNEGVRYFIHHDCYELAEVVNSPLWKALQ